MSYQSSLNIGDKVMISGLPIHKFTNAKYAVKILYFLKAPHDLQDCVIRNGVIQRKLANW